MKIFALVLSIIAMILSIIALFTGCKTKTYKPSTFILVPMETSSTNYQWIPTKR